MAVRINDRELAGNIIPDAADTRNLGSSSKSFLAVYMEQALLYSDDASFPVMKLDHTGGEWHKGAIQFLDSGVRRWQAKHVGQDLIFSRYDSGGNYQDDPLVLKEGGDVEIANDLLVDEIKEKTSGAGITLADAVEVSKTVSYAYQYLHQAPFSGWSTNAPNNGSATVNVQYLQIIINDAALTDSGEIWLPIYGADHDRYVHIDDKAVRFRVRGYLKLNDLGNSHSEVNLARIVVTGANVWLGFKFTIEVGGSPVTQTVRLYAVNGYWNGSAYTETSSLIHTWTHQSVGVAHEINFELDVASDASNAICKELITGDLATISVGDDNNQASAELDVWLWRNTANCGYDIELDIMQWTFAREW